MTIEQFSNLTSDERRAWLADNLTSDARELLRDFVRVEIEIQRAAYAAEQARSRRGEFVRTLGECP